MDTETVPIRCCYSCSKAPRWKCYLQFWRVWCRQSHIIGGATVYVEQLNGDVTAVTGIPNRVVTVSINLLDVLQLAAPYQGCRFAQNQCFCSASPSRMFDYYTIATTTREMWHWTAITDSAHNAFNISTSTAQANDTGYTIPRRRRSHSLGGATVYVEQLNGDATAFPVMP